MCCMMVPAQDIGQIIIIGRLTIAMWPLKFTLLLSWCNDHGDRVVVRIETSTLRMENESQNTESEKDLELMDISLDRL